MATNRFSLEIPNTRRVNLRIEVDELRRNPYLEYISPTYSFNSTSDYWRIELRLRTQVNENGKYPCSIGLHIDSRNRAQKHIYMYQVVCSLRQDIRNDVIIGFRHPISNSVSIYENFDFFNISHILPFSILSVNLTFDVSSALANINSKERDVNSNQDFWHSLDMYSFASNGKFSDVTIKTKDREFNAHRLILAARSPVFDAMLSSNMKEAETGVITINDIRPEVMEAMLHYMYNNEIKNMPEFAFELFQTAHKYDMKELENECRDFLESKLETKNAIPILKLAENYSTTTLIKSAVGFVQKHEDEMIKQEEYIKYLLDHLNVNNVAEYLVKAQKYKLLKFENSVKAYIAKNFREVVKNPDYKKLYNTHTDLIWSVDEYVSNVRRT